MTLVHQLFPMLLLLVAASLLVPDTAATTVSLSWPTDEGEQLAVAYGTTITLTATAPSEVSISDPNDSGCSECVCVLAVQELTSFPHAHLTRWSSLVCPGPLVGAPRYVVAQLSIGQSYSFTPIEPGELSVLHNSDPRLVVYVDYPESLKCPSGTAPLDMCIGVGFDPFQGCGAITTKAACDTATIQGECGGWYHGICVEADDDCPTRQFSDCSGDCIWYSCVPTNCSSFGAEVEIQCPPIEPGPPVPLCGSLFSRGCFHNGTSCLSVVETTESQVGV
jgi:hypothetical protein